MNDLQKKLLPELLKEIPEYGDFGVREEKNPFPKGQAIAVVPNDPKEKAEWEKAVATWQIYRNKILVLEFLVHEKFAVKREDLKHHTRLYIQLTEKGRLLKELGSLEAYDRLQKEKRDKVKREERRNSTLFWFTIVVTLSALIEAVYTGLTYHQDKKVEQLEAHIKTTESKHQRTYDSVVRLGIKRDTSQTPNKKTGR